MSNIENLNYKIVKLMSFYEQNLARKIFDEVWQYGCNMGEKDSDVIFYQDGIAPQQTLKGLEKVSSNKGGRIYPPTTWSKKNKGFNRSHHLQWFCWFYNIKKEDRGFFGPNISINNTFEK